MRIYEGNDAVVTFCCALSCGRHGQRGCGNTSKTRDVLSLMEQHQSQRNMYEISEKIEKLSPSQLHKVAGLVCKFKSRGCRCNILYQVAGKSAKEELKRQLSTDKGSSHAGDDFEGRNSILCDIRNATSSGLQFQEFCIGNVSYERLAHVLNVNHCQNEGRDDGILVYTTHLLGLFAIEYRQGHDAGSAASKDYFIRVLNGVEEVLKEQEGFLQFLLEETNDNDALLQAARRGGLNTQSIISRSHLMKQLFKPIGDLISEETIKSAMEVMDNQIQYANYELIDELRSILGIYPQLVDNQLAKIMADSYVIGMSSHIRMMKSPEDNESDAPMTALKTRMASCAQSVEGESLQLSEIPEQTLSDLSLSVISELCGDMTMAKIWRSNIKICLEQVSKIREELRRPKRQVSEIRNESRSPKRQNYVIN